MADLPDFLQGGDTARLIPVIADSSREQRVASVFLATLAAIPSFSGVLLNSLGQRVGQRTTIDTYTEVVFKSDQSNKDRPDGLISISTGNRTWIALVEAKIGRAKIDSDQVNRYLRIARDYKIDAVITISNQFAARPDHTPVSVPKTLARYVACFHWSWKYIFTEAFLQQTQGLISDPNQAFILREFIRFISHDSIGISGFNEMPPEWRDLNALLKSGGIARKTSPEVESVVEAWHQETRDVSLRLSRHLATNCELRISRTHSNDPARRVRDDCAQLAEQEHLLAEYSIPNAAADLSVCVDLKAQAIRVGMTLAAPEDRQGGPARVNWLLRQIKNVEPERIFVRIIWPGRVQDLVCPLAQLRADSKFAFTNNNQPPRVFEIFLLKDDGRRFSGRKTFIEDLEIAIPEFYDQIGQFLSSWRPKPPQPVKEDVGNLTEAKKEEEPPVTTPSQNNPHVFVPSRIVPGNNHSELLEIPDFLVRFHPSHQNSSSVEDQDLS